MSQDPKTSKSPPAAQPAETLEDAVYKPNLSEDNKALKGTNPLIAIPTTIVTYAVVAGLTFLVATKTEVGRKALKHTIGVDLIDDENKEEEPPPPPPPAPPAAAAPPLKVEVKDAPPPPPITDQEAIPDAAPKEIPKIDYSASFAANPGEAVGSGLGVIGGAAASSGLGQPGGAVGGSATIHDVPFSQVETILKPPAPPYPPMARAAKVQGTVVVEITIGVDGVPVNAVAISGPGMLHNSAVDYAKKWRFKPLMIDGHPVQAKFMLRLPYSFR